MYLEDLPILAHTYIHTHTHTFNINRGGEGGRSGGSGGERTGLAGLVLFANSEKVRSSE